MSELAKVLYANELTGEIEQRPRKEKYQRGWWSFGQCQQELGREPKPQEFQQWLCDNFPGNEDE